MTLPKKEIHFTEEQKEKGFPEKPLLPEHDPFRPATPEEIDEAVKYRNRILELADLGARLSQEELELVHSYRIEENARANNDHATLVSALIIQGRFEEAGQIDPSRADECNGLINAREKDDDCRCDCPDQFIENTTHPSEYVVRKQYVPERKAFAYLVRCGCCGELNLSVNPPGAIAQYHAKRMEQIAFNRRRQQS